MSARGASVRGVGCVGLVFVAIMLSHAAQAWAQPAATSFRWTLGAGAERCMDERALIRAVEARLGRVAFAEDAQLVIDGRIEARPGGGFRAEIVLHDGESVVGRRVLETARSQCRSLDDSLAVMVALLVEVGREVVHVVVPTVEHDDEPLGSQSEPREDASPRPTGEAPGVGMGLGALGTIDAIPGIAGFFHGAFELRWLPLTLRLEAGFAPDSSFAVADERTVRFSMGWGGLSGCLDAVVLDLLGLGGCAGLRAGAIFGSGLGFHVDEQGTMPWVALTVAGRARLFVFEDVLAFELSLGVDVPLFRDHFVVQVSGEHVRSVHTPPVVAPYLGISVLVFAG